MYLEQNIRGYCDKFGIDFLQLLSDMNVDNVLELSISDLESLAEEFDTQVQALLFQSMGKTNDLKAKIEKIKLLVLDVDGVMTDGGMYFTESGDQFKKFNTKDGMAIIHLTRSDFQVAIISSGFKGEAVKNRAEMLGIQHVSVSREKKIDTLSDICKKLNIGLENVAMIGDDINDIEVMRQIGLSFCPANAIQVVKNEVDVILKRNGGDACVRELIDDYILDKPLNK